MSSRAAPASAFRLSLEHAAQRASDTLRDAIAGDAAALARVSVSPGRAPTLGDARQAIARELGCATWTDLEAHVAAMDAQRAAIDSCRAAPDAEPRTLHVRCGSDIETTLREAGFTADFLSHAYPYVQGPVTDAENSLTLRAEFLVNAFGNHIGLSFDEVLARCRDEETKLAAAASDYARVVLWMEHDSYDQLVLVRCLGLYAAIGAPRHLELVSTDRFPGTARFLGLGQLPPEALRLLWSRRRTITRAQLALGAEAWAALAASDPRDLAAMMRSGAPELPLLAPALHRHLRELPSIENGLSLTEQLTLEILAERSLSVQRAFEVLRDEREPLPWLGDWGFDQIVASLAHAPHALVERTPDAEHWQRDRLAITDLGRAVLGGALDWLTLAPPPRWVGGVRIESPQCWRWDEPARVPARRSRSV